MSVFSEKYGASTNLLGLVFFLIGLIGILNHAMWRDELNVWLLVRDSYGFSDFIHNLKYEGHPALWYVCLYLLSRFTHNPLIMQIFHLLLATGFIYIFVKFSPFTLLQKILFSFGYLPFYEYLLISRNYALGILLVFSFCALFPTRKKSYLLLSVILCLLANANAYCLFISFALGLTLIGDCYARARNDKRKHSSNVQRQSLPTKRGDLIASLLIFTAGIVISSLTLIPPTDSTLAGGITGWMLEFDIRHLAKTLTRIWSSYIAIIVPGESKDLDLTIFSILSLGIFAFSSTLFLRKPVALFFYVFASLEVLFFTYVKFLGSPRHYGHLYIILLVSLWLASYYPKSNLLMQRRSGVGKGVIYERQNSRAGFVQGLFVKCKTYLLNPPLQPVPTLRWLKFVDKHKKSFLMVILYCQLAAGIVAFSRDMLVPLSASRDAARFIQSQKLDKMFIVGSRDYAVSPLCGYLNRKIYYPELNQLGSFVLFVKKRNLVDATAVLEQVSQLLEENNTNILLVLNYSLDTTRPNLSISELAKFTNSFIYDEQYYLYLVKPAA